MKSRHVESCRVASRPVDVASRRISVAQCIVYVSHLSSHTSSPTLALGIGLALLTLFLSLLMKAGVDAVLGAVAERGEHDRLAGGPAGLDLFEAWSTNYLHELCSINNKP